MEEYGVTQSSLEQIFNGFAGTPPPLPPLSLAPLSLTLVSAAQQDEEVAAVRGMGSARTSPEQHSAPTTASQNPLAGGSTGSREQSPGETNDDV